MYIKSYNALLAFVRFTAFGWKLFARMMPVIELRRRKFCIPRFQTLPKACSLHCGSFTYPQTAKEPQP